MSPANHIQKVAIVGAGGNAGSYMVQQLLKTGKHTVTAITRPESTNEVPSGVQVCKVNYADHASLVEALKGQDALIVTMSVTAPKGQENKIVDAAIEAGVPWILPNEWGLDNQNESVGQDSMLGDSKKSVRNAIVQSGTSSCLSFVTGFWYEWSIGYVDGYGIDFKNKRAVLYDDGTQTINTSTWPQVGRGVASLLSLPIAKGPDGEACLEDFKNKFIYISSFEVSQKDMLASAMRVTGTTEADWEISHMPYDERRKQGLDQLASGDRRGFIKVLYVRAFKADGAGNHAKTRGLANGVLGLSDSEDFDAETKLGMERALGPNIGVNGY